MATVLAKDISYATGSEQSSSTDLNDEKKEPKVTARPLNIPPLGHPKDEKRFWFQRSKVC